MSKVLYDGFNKIEEVEAVVNGKTVTREKLVLPSAVAGVVMSRNGLIALVKQYRPAVSQYTYELPAGILDKDLSPRETLLEEVMEECGVEDENVISVYERPHHTFFINIGSSDATCAVYRVGVNIDMEEGEQDISDDHDVESVIWIEPSTFTKMFAEGKIVDPKTIIGFYDVYTSALEYKLLEG